MRVPTMQVPYEQTEQPLISAAHGKLHEISVSRLMTDVLAFHIFPVLRSLRSSAGQSDRELRHRQTGTC